MSKLSNLRAGERQFQISKISKKLLLICFCLRKLLEGVLYPNEGKNQEEGVRPQNQGLQLVLQRIAVTFDNIHDVED